MARRYCLHSTEGICTPGIVRKALHVMRGPDPELQVWGLKLLMTGYPQIPGGIIASLMAEDDNVCMEINHVDETVTFSCTDEQEQTLGMPTEES